MSANPALDRLHILEPYQTAAAATERVERCRAAGYRAYSVRMERRLWHVHISEGKHPDLARLPARREPRARAPRPTTPAKRRKR